MLGRGMACVLRGRVSGSTRAGRPEEWGGRLGQQPSLRLARLYMFRKTHREMALTCSNA
jgi:hypothetical protein